MACGTPVIASRRGSMPEIIRDGENGFLVDTQDEAVAAVDASSSLDRAAVRASVEGRFDVERMVDDYLALYRARRRTPPRHARSASRPSAERRDPGGSRSGSASTTGRRVPRWAGGRASIRRRSKPTLRGSRPRSRLRAGVSHLGRLPAGPGPGRPRDARAARRGRRSRRRARARADPHPLHRPHERSELDPSLGARRLGRRSSLPGRLRRHRRPTRAPQLVQRSGGRRCSGSPGHRGCRRPRRARGGLGVGPRQRELQLCRPAEQPVGPRSGLPA